MKLKSFTQHNPLLSVTVVGSTAFQNLQGGKFVSMIGVVEVLKVEILFRA